jgi:hypothetical protein
VDYSEHPFRAPGRLYIQPAACNTELGTKDQSLGVVLPTQVYYRYAQISAVGREK